MNNSSLPLREWLSYSGKLNDKAVGPLFRNYNPLVNMITIMSKKKDIFYLTMHSAYLITVVLVSGIGPPKGFEPATKKSQASALLTELDPALTKTFNVPHGIQVKF